VLFDLLIRERIEAGPEHAATLPLEKDVDALEDKDDAKLKLAERRVILTRTSWIIPKTRATKGDWLDC